ncbi:MAG: hypothetical protein IPM36_04390 [Lewinellaceae bacterium]|nr:hypothetical protein [Lewinellaceae bacterium]
MPQPNFYFRQPPERPETTDPTSLGFCPNGSIACTSFLMTIIPKIVYPASGRQNCAGALFGTFTQDSFWCWASAGKSLRFLVGQAQEAGLLHLDDPTNDYLGPDGPVPRQPRRLKLPYATS